MSLKVELNRYVDFCQKGTNFTVTGDIAKGTLQVKEETKTWSQKLGTQIEPFAFFFFGSCVAPRRKSAEATEGKTLVAQKKLVVAATQQLPLEGEDALEIQKLVDKVVLLANKRMAEHDVKVGATPREEYSKPEESYSPTLVAALKKLNPPREESPTLPALPHVLERIPSRPNITTETESEMNSTVAAEETTSTEISNTAPTTSSDAAATVAVAALSSTATTSSTAVSAGSASARLDAKALILCAL